MSEEEIARKLGFRVRPFSSGYQVQRLDADGRVLSVAPAQRYAYQLWLMCVELGAPDPKKEVVADSAGNQAAPQS